MSSSNYILPSAAKDIKLLSNISSTPGGTLYGTTPGGTRIIYDRQYLLQLKDSPYSQTPPKSLINLPEIFMKTSDDVKKQHYPIHLDIVNNNDGMALMWFIVGHAHDGVHYIII